MDGHSSGATGWSDNRRRAKDQTRKDIGGAGLARRGEHDELEPVAQFDSGGNTDSHGYERAEDGLVDGYLAKENRQGQ